MNLKMLSEICNEINSCSCWKNSSIECGRDQSADPKTVEIRNTQRILLVTRDPSNQANKLEGVTDYENSFFRDKILPILFSNYEASKAKKDRAYFEKYREDFLDLFYWTHYQKCFPGKNDNGHKKPKKQCADKYLKRETEAFDPELIICVGSKAVKHITGEKLLPAISKNGKNHTMFSGKKIPVISLTHPSGANNGSKNNPLYRYEETILLVQEAVNHYFGNTSDLM